MEVTPKIDDITPDLGSVDSSVGISIVGSGFGNSPTVNVAGGGITVSGQSSSDTSISVTLNISAEASAGSHNITVTANGKQSNALSFFVQIPTKLQRDSVGNLVDQPGGCGVTRTVQYTLLDQNGDPIDVNGEIVEALFDFSGPQGLSPPPETIGSITHGHITDTVGYLTPTCPPAFTATVSQSFTVELATQGHAWALSSQNAISEGRTSTGSKFVNITFTQ